MYPVIPSEVTPHTVILNEAQRSEDSKIIARTPSTDFRFVAALGMAQIQHALGSVDISRSQPVIPAQAGIQRACVGHMHAGKLKFGAKIATGSSET